MNAPLPGLHPSALPHMASTAGQLPQTLYQARGVEQIVHGEEVMDGAGVRIRRLIDQRLQRRLDPWLMLDMFRSDQPADYLAGFPDHPHRGFETITYMLAGRMRHRDSAGHQGLLQSGGVQWMRAGRGVIHSEMPEQQHGLMSGIQLWLNLPASDKLSAPWYQDFQADELPHITTTAGVGLRVIAGHSHGLAGLVERPHTQPLYLHLSMPAASHFSQPLADTHHACVVVLQGQVDVVAGHITADTRAQSAGHTTVSTDQLAILSNTAGADGVYLRTGSTTASEVLLIAGCPLNEPIVQRGPFVMNSEAEVRQAFMDYRLGRFAS